MAPDLSGDRTSPAVECAELVIRYGDTVAVDGLSFTAEAGQVVALLGPNGAGKTSTVESLEGYRAPASGSVRVLGLDPRADKVTLLPRIGVMLQRGGIYPTMSAGQVVSLFAAYYDDPEDPGALLELVGLTAVARTPWRRLSGGEQQRLSLALALVGRPAVLFLDEPTAGVDPEGRLAVRRVISSRRDAGVCVLLTTHELTEAERLADDVVIIAAGRAVARGSVRDLAARAGGGGIQFAAPAGLDVDALADALGVSPGEVHEPAPGNYRIAGEATATRLAAVARFLEERGLPVSELRAGGSSLEDVYLSLVGSSGERR